MQTQENQRHNELRIEFEVKNNKIRLFAAIKTSHLAGALILILSHIWKEKSRLIFFWISFSFDCSFCS